LASVVDEHNDGKKAIRTHDQAVTMRGSCRSSAVAPKSGSRCLDRCPKGVRSGEDVEGRVEPLDHGTLVAPRRLRDDKGDAAVFVHPAGERGLINEARSTMARQGFEGA
jgi:hypothetical protein